MEKVTNIIKKRVPISIGAEDLTCVKTAGGLARIVDKSLRFGKITTQSVPMLPHWTLAVCGTECT